MTMFDRIEMNVIDMPRVVGIASNQMLPIAPLPDAALTLFLPAGRAPFRRRQVTREFRLDQRPALCKCRIIRRQGPYRMQMIGQDHDRIDMERMTPLDQSHGIPQDIDRVNQQGARPLRQIDSEKISAARNVVTPIAHVFDFVLIEMRRLPEPKIGMPSVLGWLEVMKEPQRHGKA